MKKRYLLAALGLSVVMAASVVGCGGNSGSNDTNQVEDNNGGSQEDNNGGSQEDNNGGSQTESGTLEEMVASDATVQGKLGDIVTNVLTNQSQYFSGLTIYAKGDNLTEEFKVQDGVQLQLADPNWDSEVATYTSIFGKAPASITITYFDSQGNELANYTNAK